MKKILIKLFIGVLSVLVVLGGLVACGGKDWSGTTMNEWGQVKSVGGFIAETDNYFYYINGMANSADDNTFGTPIKGTLMAIDKSDMEKTEIVVPELFASTDYNAGLFIDEEYVYYGTPNTDKTSDGSIASSEMVFTKTKLDGTGSERLFKVNTHSTEYRMVKNGDKVYIVYYDSAESALISYDTVAKQKTVIAKTDEKTEGNYSLGEYKFVNDTADGVSVIFALTVYSEPYLEDKAQEQNYSRAMENYNLVYAYKAGDAVSEQTNVAGKVIFDGSEKDSKYSITLSDKEYIFVTETTALGKTKIFGAKSSDMYSGNVVEIKNQSYVASGNLIVSLDEVYALTDGTVYKGSMTADDKLTKEKVVIKDTVSKLLFVKNNDLYYFNTNNQIARIEMKNADANEVVVTENTVNTNWYAPELITIGANEYLFYLDNSSFGASYVHYIDVNGTVNEKDTNDDKEADFFYLDGAVFMGKMTDQDKASTINALIGDVATEIKDGVLNFTEKDDALTVEKVTEARLAYNALTDEVKKLVSESSLTTLQNYEKAVEMANLYAELDGMSEYDTMSQTEQQALESAYQSVKAQIEEFIASDDYSVISAYLNNNLKWNYQKAVKTFEVEE